MKHLLLLSAAVALVACSDEPSTAPAHKDGAGAAPTAPAMRSMTGTIETAGGLAIRVDGMRIRLTGAAAAPLASLDGAEVEVTGTDDVVDYFNVEMFSVLRVDGLPAADGILQQSEGGYALLLQNGATRAVIDPPAELQALVGHRVWIAGAPGAAPEAFGLIQ